MNAFEKALLIVEAALNKKSHDVVVLQIEHLASIADYFVIASGLSTVQVAAIVQGIEERLQHEGIVPLSVEGLGLCFVCRLARAPAYSSAEFEFAPGCASRVGKALGPQRGAFSLSLGTSRRTKGDSDNRLRKVGSFAC